MLSPILAIALAAALFPSSLSARVWTNDQGNKIEAELVELKGAADQQVAVLKMANGRTYDVPLASLSEADQAYAKKQITEMDKAESDGVSSEESSGPSVFKKLLAGKLVVSDGKRLSKYEMEKEPEYYAFYFSAGWCGPCRQFTPSLISFYQENAEAKKTFEIIFVSRDNGEKEMENYMAEEKMPWPAIKYRYVSRMKEVTKYLGPGIPCLVLVDRQGKVVADSYVNGEYVTPASVVRKIEALIAGKKVAASPR